MRYVRMVLELKVSNSVSDKVLHRAALVDGLDACLHSLVCRELTLDGIELPFNVNVAKIESAKARQQAMLRRKVKNL